jgi:Tfp pilus assembly protein PilO
MKNDTGIIKHNVSKKGYLSALQQFTKLQSKKSTRQYTTIILSIATLIIFGVFAINPTVTTIVKLQKQVGDYQALDQKLTQKVSNLQALQREFDMIEKDLPVINDALPVTPKTPIFIAQIQSIIDQNNLTLDQVQASKIPYTKEGVPQDQTGSAVISFTISGTYDDINKFIITASTFDRSTLIDQVSLFRDQENPGILKATVNIKTFFDQKPI